MGKTMALVPSYWAVASYKIYHFPFKYPRFLDLKNKDGIFRN